MNRIDLWTQAQIQTLIDMAEEGAQAPEIALAVDRTATAVRSYARDHGVRIKRGRPDGSYQRSEHDELRVSSEALAEATNALIQRMPANDVVAVLGAPSHPRIVCAPFKTQSALRMLAA